MRTRTATRGRTLSCAMSISVVAFGVSLFASASTHAQVVWGETYLQIDSSDGSDLLPTFIGDGSPLVSPTVNGFTLTGDLTAVIQPGFDGSGFIDIRAHRRFTVGELPVTVAPTSFFEGKVTNPFFSDVTVDTNVRLDFEFDSNGIPDPNDFAISSSGFGPAAGPQEFVEFDTAQVVPLGQSEGLLLSAGRSYFMTYVIQMTIGGSEGSFATGGFDPSFEFGGASAFNGATTALTWQIVPAPGALAVFAMGAPIVARRRH